MKTTINNDLIVYQVITSTGKQVFCNIEQLNDAVMYLYAHEGYFKIFQFWDNKPKRLSKKDLKLMFEGAGLTQEFYY